MNLRITSVTALIGAALLATTSPIVAQGTTADYERAAALRGLTRGKVVGMDIEPTWSGDGDRLWYRLEHPDGRREYMTIDATSGQRTRAFDHQALAAAIQERTGGPVDADRLPVRSFEVEDGEALRIRLNVDRATITVRIDGEGIRIEEAEQGGESGGLPAMTPSPQVRSGSSQGDSSITFVNRMDEPLRVHWIDTSGGRTAYATIEPGGSHEQHTYSSHAWVATTLDDRDVAMFIAADQPARAVITGRVTNTGRGAGRGRRGGGGNRGGAGRGAPNRSPDARLELFFQDGNAFLRDAQSGAERALSDNGSPDDRYGGRAQWSPDSAHVVVTQAIPEQEHTVYYVQSTPSDQFQPKLQSYQYLKPGDQTDHPRPRLFDVETGERIEIDEALFDNPWSIGNIHWAPDSSRFFFLYNQRGHQVMRVISVDARTGAARAIINEEVPTFFDYSNKTFLRYLDDTNEIIWMSERDGWNHLYLIDAYTGDVKNQITTGEWVVRGVDEVDVENRQIWFRAMGIHPDQDPYHVHYARVNFDGSDLTVLTGGDGTHSIDYSPDRRFVLDTYSRVDLPPVYELRRVSDGSRIAELGRADWTPAVDAGWIPPERFVSKARDGETDIWGMIFRPTNFDPQKKYPIIESIYAGPHGAHVPKSFRPYYNEQAMCELGFIVVKIDGMGTNWRSKKFHDYCWKNIGDAGFPDRKLWIKAAAAKYPFMDTTRVGIYGGSAGGQNAMRALLDHHDLYDVAVADCGCHDNRMDKIWWNEAWMGWPVDESYERSSNSVDAHKLEGHLLLTVGEADRNVDPASTMQVVDALIKANKDFDLIVFPGGGHGAGSGAYGQRRRNDFFVRHLHGVEPRRE